MQFLRYIPNNLDDFSEYEVIDDFSVNNNHCVVYRNEDHVHLALGNFKGNGNDVLALFVWEDYNTQNEMEQNREIVSIFALNFRNVYRSTAGIVKKNFPTSIVDRVRYLNSMYGVELSQNRGEVTASFYKITNVEQISNAVWSVILHDTPYMSLNNENAARDIANLIGSDINQFINMRWNQ